MKGLLAVAVAFDHTRLLVADATESAVVVEVLGVRVAVGRAWDDADGAPLGECDGLRFLGLGVVTLVPASK